MRSVQPSRIGVQIGLLALFVMLFGGAVSRAGEPELQMTVRKLPDVATSVAFSPSSEIVAVGSYETVELWNISDKKKLGAIPVKSGFARSLAFSPDGSLLAIGGYQRIHLHQVESRQLVRDIKGHRGYVTALVWPATGPLWSASEDKTVRSWSTSDWSEQSQISDFPAAVAGIALSLDGTLLGAAGGDETQLSSPGFVQLRKLSGELVLEPKAPKMAATDIAFTRDGLQIVVTGFDEKGHVYKVDTGALSARMGDIRVRRTASPSQRKASWYSPHRAGDSKTSMSCISGR